MTKRNRRGLTQREYAERVGVSQQRISSLSRQKKVVKFPDGSIDPDRTDALLADVLDISHRPGFGPTAKGGESGDVESTAETSELTAAKTKKARYDAELSKLKYQELAGQLVKIEAVAQAVNDIGRLVSTRLQAWPNKLAPELAAETDPTQVNAILEEEINRLVEEMQNGLGRLSGDNS